MGRALVPRVEDASGSFLWRGGFRHRTGGCPSRGEHGVNPRYDPWAIQL